MNEIIIIEPKAIAHLEKSYDFKDLTIKKELVSLWSKAIVRTDKLAEAKAIAAKLIRYKPRYSMVSMKTGVPWFIIGCIHHMESDCNFNTHLHNGDSLSRRTVQVPAGRPVAGNPPFTWEESACDALGYDHFVGEKDWSIEHILFMLEAYNGFGYRNHGCLSCYVWAGTTVQTKGRYVADSKFDPNGWSERVGCAAIIETLINLKEVDLKNTAPVIPIPENPRGIILWKINEIDSSDVRGYDADGKVVCWMDSEHSLEKMYYNAVLAGAPKARFITAKLDKKPIVVPR